ncbi:hypothetical protein [Nostoc sp.]|uniref:hypothetical protein n=1 Tax=Nostoc sp. TaxID=1180 RepID=UPI002FF529F9
MEVDAQNSELSVYSCNSRDPRVIPIQLIIATHSWVETRRQSLQRGEPPFGFTSRLRRETRLQGWIHRNALAHESRLYKWSICRILFLNWYKLWWVKGLGVTRTLTKLTFFMAKRP